MSRAEAVVNPITQVESRPAAPNCTAPHETEQAPEPFALHSEWWKQEIGFHSAVGGGGGFLFLCHDWSCSSRARGSEGGARGGRERASEGGRERASEGGGGGRARERE
jgi:hypothetical protein